MRERFSGSIVTVAMPLIPFAERHSVERLGHGFFHINVKLGFHADAGHSPDAQGLRIARLRRRLRSRPLLHRPRIAVRHAKDSAMAPISFAIFAFLTKIASPAPDFFPIPRESLSEVGFRVDI